MQAQFIPGSMGPLLAVYFPPAGSVPHRSNLVYVPPFAEEMNRSRWLIANAARHFARAGFGILVVDPFGTGDSGGDFVDARWEIWRRDVALCLDWARQQYQVPTLLWGLRLGASLAVEASQAGAAHDGLVLWHPVIRGRQFIDQFLRIAVAQSVTKAHGVRSVEEIRGAMAKSGEAEVAGFQIHRDLIDNIDGIDLRGAGPGAVTSVSWIDVTASAEAMPRPDSIDSISAWSMGATASFDTAVAPQFWSLPEPESAPNLIEATLRRLEALL